MDIYPANESALVDAFEKSMGAIIVFMNFQLMTLNVMVNPDKPLLEI